MCVLVAIHVLVGYPTFQLSRGGVPLQESRVLPVAVLATDIPSVPAELTHKEGVTVGDVSAIDYEATTESKVPSWASGTPVGNTTEITRSPVGREIGGLYRLREKTGCRDGLRAGLWRL